MVEVSVVPVVGMVMVECIQAGLLILNKVAMSSGMSKLVFVFYSNALASVVLPISYLFHRSETELPQLTVPILGWFFFVGLLRFFGLISRYAGINYSSRTLATTLHNLTPGFTFTAAVILRMERFNWRISSTIAKTVGAIVSIAGALIVTLYEEPSLIMTFSSSNWILGGLLLVADSLMATTRTIAQVSILKKYQAVPILVLFSCFTVAVLSGFVSFIVEKEPSAWSLKSRTRLLAVLYSGVIGTALRAGLRVWCLQKTGPVFVAMFKPLGAVITAALGFIFMGETVFLGRLIGAIIIVVGFYSVMWGKAKEAKIDADDGAGSLEANRQQAPLLGTTTQEE